MLLKKKVKAGILIYALLISAIFAMLLQFYLGRIVASQRQHQAQISQSQSYLMAQMTARIASKDKGQLIFKEGQTSYEKTKENISIQVQLTNQQTFSYTFLAPSLESHQKTK
ncbi:competence type IV pilus minor pilin ComGG [Streptococcus zalophi]|uniref:Competence protein ComGG n=1 Tax=Streptococcus zalophi TaxID=640031 RepID=A0A934PAR3_9STRE|nr:competence type IV pilus minor pilin ComGG [Streptococcus zalophi]MBJ8350200.1 competence protein ComGG [Streptococcus zalophi]